MGKKRKRSQPAKSKPIYPSGVAESHGVLSFDRIEAMSRIVDTAIWLWMLEKDPLSIHVLIMSQFTCLQGLAAQNTDKAPFAATYVEPKQLVLVYDFLRHSSCNPSVGVDFKADNNDALLFDVICSFNALFNRMTLYMKAFLTYFSLWKFARNDPSFSDAADYELPKGVAMEDFQSLSRKALFTKLIEAFREDAVVGVHIESP